jgi:hypothetical protein
MVGGRSAVSFLSSILDVNGLGVESFATAEPDLSSSEPSVGFKFAKQDLRLRLVDGVLAAFDGGTVAHDGGFKLTSKTGAIDARGFSVVPGRSPEKSLQLRARDARGEYVAFVLENPRSIFDPAEGVLTVSSMDMILTKEGAGRLGRAELEGLTVGMLSMFADSEIIDGLGPIVSEVREPLTAGGGAPIDVALSAMSSLQSAGRVGAFPNGRNGLTMSTTSCNVGTGNIEWRAPMQVQHPVIAMNLYRVLNGRFEQVGWSWLKHGFLSTNSNGCGSCQHPGTGSLLGVNCSDTYGPSNNSDRTYLGGRDEVNPFTGVWTCQNSWFSNYVNDCVRRNPGMDPLDAVDHRLEVLDADLGNSGATYYYEAYYINPSDFDRYNNCGSRTATMTWTGSNWSFTTTTNMVQGPAINRWGEMRSTAQPQTDGDVILAVQTTDLGGGMYRYEYALYNHDLDRQIRTFSIPVPNAATVTNVGFRDIDQDPNNQWPSNRTSTAIVWSTGTFGSGTANPLKYSSVFNFRFDANVPPSSSAAVLGLFKPGTGTELAAATRGPLVLSPLDSHTVVNGVNFGGNHDSLTESDNDRLILGPTSDGSRFGTGLIGMITAPQGTINSITVGVESNNTLTNGNPTQKIELWDWVASAWVQLDSRPTTVADSTVIVPVTSNVARFVNGSREVQVRVIHNTNLGLVGNRWKLALDQVGLKFN